MLALLEACHFKISCAVAHLAGRDYPNSKYSPYIEKTKDKTVSVFPKCFGFQLF